MTYVTKPWGLGNITFGPQPSKPHSVFLGAPQVHDVYLPPQKGDGAYRGQLRTRKEDGGSAVDQWDGVRWCEVFSVITPPEKTMSPEEVLGKIKQGATPFAADWTYRHGWEQFVPKIIQEAWPALSSESKHMVRLMGLECKNINDELAEDTFF